jgi:hypothetical protein
MGAQPPPGLSDEKAARILSALREGHTLKQFSMSGNCPRFIAYCEAHADYGREAIALLAENIKLSNARKGARLRNLTHCKHGHPFAGKNLYISPDGKERRCWTCMKQNGNFGRRMSEDQARKVVEALNEGKTIANVTASGPSYILSHRALLLFRQKHPKFERLVLRLSTANAKVHHAEAAARRTQVLRAPAIDAHGADIFMLIRSAVPANPPAQIRDDVIGAMALEIVEGKLRPTDIRRCVREYVAVQYRQFSKFGRVSLDARLFEDGNATLLDRLSTEAGTGYWDINMMASTGRRK